MKTQTRCEFCGINLGKAYHSCEQARFHRDLTGKGYKLVEVRKNHRLYQHPTNPDKFEMVYKEVA